MTHPHLLEVEVPGPGGGIQPKGGPGPHPAAHSAAVACGWGKNVAAAAQTPDPYPAGFTVTMAARLLTARSSRPSYSAAQVEMTNGAPHRCQRRAI